MKKNIIVYFFMVMLVFVSCTNIKTPPQTGPGQGAQPSPSGNGSLEASLKLIDEKKFDEAIKILDGEISKNKNSEELYTARGRAYFGKKMYDKALENFKKAQSLNPDNPETYVNLGNFHLVMWDIDNARKQFDKALEKDPQNVGALHGVGICYAKKLDYSTAIIWYDRVIKLDPKNSGCFDNRAFAEYYTLKFDDSLKDFNKAVELNPEFSHSYFGRARILIREKKWKEALDDLNNAVKYEDDFYEAYHARGVLFADRFDYEKALKDLDYSVKLQPESTISHYERGLVYMWMGKFDKARNDFEIARRCKTKVYTFSVREVDITGPVMLADGIAAYLMGKNDAAIKEQIKKGIAITEDLDNPFDNEFCNIGYGYYILGDNKKAVANFDAALKSDPEIYQAYYGRALAKLKLGKKKEAVDDLIISSKKLPKIWLRQKSMEMLKNQNYDLNRL